MAKEEAGLQSNTELNQYPSCRCGRCLPVVDVKSPLHSEPRPRLAGLVVGVNACYRQLTSIYGGFLSRLNRCH